MTTKEKLIQMCIDRGMSREPATQVLEIAMVEIDKDGRHKTTWNRPSDEYPEALYAVMFLTVARAAVEWIDKNIPDAWFREMFIQIA